MLHGEGGSIGMSVADALEIREVLKTRSNPVFRCVLAALSGRNGSGVMYSWPLPSPLVSRLFVSCLARRRERLQMTREMAY